MKHFSTLILCIALCATSMVAQHRPMNRQSFVVNKETLKVSKTNPLHRSGKLLSRSGEIWRPATEEYYLYMGEWMLDGTILYTYDNLGQVASAKMLDMDGLLVDITKYTYDENGYKTQELISTEAENGVITLTSKNTYVYDEKVFDFITNKSCLDWDGANWNDSYKSFRRPVTRNAEGNVTNITVSIPYMGAYDETEKTDITYDPVTGKANTYVFSTLTYDGVEMTWEKSYDIFDIEWENTNGQIVLDWGSLIIGDNRVKKASYYYNGAMDGYRIVKYVDGKIDFEIDETDNEGNVLAEHNYVTTDANGSFREDIYEHYIDFHMYQVGTYNEHGDLTQIDEYEVMDGEELLMFSEKYIYTYDETTGVVSEVETLAFNDEIEDYEPTMKVVYSNYVDAAGVENLVSNSKLVYHIDGNALTVSMAGMKQYELYSIAGVAVAADEAQDNAVLDISGLANGVYVLKAISNNDTQIAKFVKR